jgi:death on curing protein
MRQLSLEEIRAIHALTVAQFGGSNTERAASAEYFGVPLHPTASDQASAYLYHLCQAHAFVDGNKRTAVFAMLAYLHLNGYRLRASNDDLFQLVVKIANGTLEKTEVAAQIESWLEVMA